jgi:hypothetical protein
VPQLAAGTRAHRALRRLRAENGLDGVKNSKLLALAVENGFDVFLTGDRNLTFQQNTSTLSIAIIVPQADGIQLHHTLPLMPKVLALLPALKPGQVVKVTK